MNQKHLDLDNFFDVDTITTEIRETWGDDDIKTLMLELIFLLDLTEKKLDALNKQGFFKAVVFGGR